jgi:CDP-diglyceride synthetase
MLLLLLLLIVGLLMYLLLNRPEQGKLAEVGRILFGVSLLVVLWPMAATRLSGDFPSLGGNPNVLWIAIIIVVVLVLVLVGRRYLPPPKS